MTNKNHCCLKKSAVCQNILNILLILRKKFENEFTQWSHIEIFKVNVHSQSFNVNVLHSSSFFSD